MFLVELRRKINDSIIEKDKISHKTKKELSRYDE